jgi:hypothetical protein
VRSRKRLADMVPGMLSTIREGLVSIDFPLAESKAFFDELMAIHQRVLKGGPDAGQAPAAIRHGSAASRRDAVEQRFNAGDSVRNFPWLAPREARESGFVDLPDTGGAAGFDSGLGTGGAADPMPGFEATQPFDQRTLPQAAPQSAGAPDSAGQHGADIAIALGDWIELLTHDSHWMRAQLTWVSPQRTLFMFMGEGGRSHSMTNRVLQHLLKHQLAKIAVQRSVLNGALDTVARTAFRNSVTTSVDFDPATD